MQDGAKGMAILAMMDGEDWPKRVSDKKKS